MREVASAYEGRLATVGYVDGVMKAEMDIEALHSKRLKLFGVSNKMRNGAQRGVTVEGFKHDFLPLFASGKLKPVIDKVYDFKDLPGGQGAHAGRRPRRQDRRADLNSGSGSQLVFAYAKTSCDPDPEFVLTAP